MKSTALPYLFITLSSLVIGGYSVNFYIYSQTQFQMAIGGTSDDHSNSMIQTSDGGYSVVGFTNFFGAGTMISIL